jgi:hypothetical protein
MKTLEFILEDQAKTLFPNKTTQLLIKHGEPVIRDYIEKCFDEEQPAFYSCPNSGFTRLNTT